MSDSTAALSWRDVSERYRARVAPSGLQLTQALANSIALQTPRDHDPLDHLETADRWITTLTDHWADAHRVARPRVEVTARGLARIRRFRGSLRDALLHARLPALDSSVAIVTQDRKLTIVPRGKNADWLEGAIAAELLLAEENDTLRRLKLCRNPTCEIAFFDRSRNNSKVWHDVAICGVPHNVRAYRARQRTDAGA